LATGVGLTVPGGLIIAAIVPLAIVLAVLSFMCGMLVLMLRGTRQRYREAMDAGLALAAQNVEIQDELNAARVALDEIKRRRSAATAKGNRTRGAAQAEKRKAMLAALQDAIAVKRAGGQHSLPLGDGGADFGAGAWGTAPHPILPPEGGRAL